MPLLKRPLTFATPSVVSDSLKARAKVERDYKEIVQEAVRYLGSKRVKELNKEVAIARRGRKPNRALNELVLAEWDAAAADGPVDIPEFSKAFIKKYPQQARSAGAIEKRLERQLRARNRDRRLKAALQRPSLVGKARGTE
jgi:hypothetical protein